MTSYFVSFLKIDSTVDPNTHVFIIDATNNNVTVTLPEATGADGQCYSFKRQDTNVSNTVSIVGISSVETVDGNISLSLSSGEKVKLICWSGLWYSFV